jgi:mycothiol synthase
MTGTVRVEQARPAPDAVRALAESATAADGVAPLSEPVLIDLHENAGRHVVATRDGALVGYAHLDREDSAELVVHPGARRHGVGGRLLDEIEAAGATLAWAHGRRPAALAFAAARGWTAERTLWQLRRPLADDLPDRPLPDGISLRPFRVGEDEDDWVRVNARAFAHHPEQGAWTAADVRLREAESWFDPAGFLLAVRADGSLAGFHWTKVHPGPPPIGEVYVLGVDPDAQGTGLGPALTVAGLRWLRERGLSDVLLYVDDDNPGAVRLYQRLGFTEWDADVQFRRPSTPA